MNRSAPAAIPEQTFRAILVRNVSLPLLVAGVMSAIFISLVFYLMNVNRWVDHADQVIGKTNQAVKQLIDAETGLRGYLLTGREVFLDPYNSAATNLPTSISELRDLLAEYPNQVAWLGRGETGYKDWRNYAARMITLKGSADPEAQKQVLGADAEEGKRRMDDMRGFFTQIIQAQEALRAQRNREASDTITWLVIATILVGVVAGALMAFNGRRQLKTLSAVYATTLGQQQLHTEQLERQAWLKTGQGELGQRMLGEQALGTLSDNILNFLVNFLGASVGAIYVTRDNRHFQRMAHYAWSEDAAHARNQFELAQGLSGQAAAENRIMLLTDLPETYIRVASALGQTAPRAVLIMPAQGERKVNTVIELGFASEVPPMLEEFARLASYNIGTAIESAMYRERLQDVLAETQQLNEELQAQQEELKVANEELEEQSRTLKESQVRLESQQAELEQNNEQLGEQTEALLQQKAMVEERNKALREAHLQLEARAEELGRTSRYKSEFLANMSHELRTPLNSALILAKLLSDNPNGNLDAEQVKFAQSIYSAGNDLLTLINDILDLSKVEAGKLELWPQSITPRGALEPLEQLFRPLAASRNIDFEIVLEPSLPPQMYTDPSRLQQILKNLLSNALKFTDKGRVTLTARAAPDGHVAFDVRDTGIGIAEEYLEHIFGAFSQADGATNRKYGGTGLGLSISRDLAHLLGGDITVHSKVGEGSVFTLTVAREISVDDDGLVQTQIPARLPALSVPAPAPIETYTPAAAEEPESPAVQDDRDVLRPDRRTVLIIEDEPEFSQVLAALGHEKGFNCIVAHSAGEGLKLAQRYVPDAVLLDMKLPDHSGLTVLERLKEETSTRHIPVHMVSGVDSSQAALQLGAIGYALKPADREALLDVFRKIETKLSQKIKHVLVVEDDARQRESMTQLIADEDVRITAVALAEEALAQLKETVFDCMVVDLTLPDMAGHELLQRMASDDLCSFPPVIVYTGRELSRAEENELRRYSRSIIIKGARSPERLLDEVTLFLHRVENTLAPERQQMLKVARNREKAFEGRKILLVDDDVRNIFALTSALEQKGAKVEIGRNGIEALEKLDADPDIDLVLMDIMMPQMDGFEAMRRIREQARFSRLPIIAVTAKAMRDDQEKCLQAGANDYLAKPIDLDKLVSLIRVWMPKIGSL
ncbi:response regulator [Amantichitinum ursilacus]|uniref:Virulence sensor protein BvgS n=1 Tax=Amantichitinum ursilacus TaxID=857265 RepID=A0A0N0XH11_9NEIS|nr:response regulator [Amantichitinum ursilacus]KPC49089.1 Aerobic respiration control sensor protein ArcB [Amantichitinum ursilacus]